MWGKQPIPKNLKMDTDPLHKESCPLELRPLPLLLGHNELRPQELVVLGLVKRQGVEKRVTSALEAAPGRNQLLGLFQQGDLDVETEGTEPPTVGEVNLLAEQGGQEGRKKAPKSGALGRDETCGTGKDEPLPLLQVGPTQATRGPVSLPERSSCPRCPGH
jgi:hypothetical protein